jgi:hypothetical protein
MLQRSGATTYDQIVDFCISCKIPISRMLQLDLLRVVVVTPTEPNTDVAEQQPLSEAAMLA